MAPQDWKTPEPPPASGPPEDAWRQPAAPPPSYPGQYAPPHVSATPGAPPSSAPGYGYGQAPAQGFTPAQPTSYGAAPSYPPSPYAPGQGFASAPAYPAAAPPAAAPRHAAYDLRPLTIGEILDRTFSVYRSRFWLFVGIASVSGVVQLLASAVSLLVAHRVRLHAGATAGLLSQQIGAGLATLLFFFAAAVTQAATVWALDKVYLGREASIGTSLKATAGKWYRYVAIAIWQAWSLMWMPMLLIIPAAVLSVVMPGKMIWLSVVLLLVGVFGGFVFGVISYLRNGLGVQATVIEGLTIRQSMRRSKVLSSGGKGVIFVVYLIAFAMLMVAGILQLPLVFFVVRAPGEEHILIQAIQLLVNFFAHTVVTPVLLIGLSLVYFDRRVRKEAFDLMLMMGGDTSATPLAPAQGYASGSFPPQAYPQQGYGAPAPAPTPWGGAAPGQYGAPQWTPPPAPVQPAPLQFEVAEPLPPRADTAPSAAPVVAPATDDTTRGE